ncbi:MAG: AzlD domain-containing protein [Bacillota bacterium]|nr:AzlD domain-containing protein [Bacillota bacterium]
MKLLIIGMATVTIIPRVLPFYIFEIDRLPKVVKNFLECIPYTVLGALIFPGALNGIVNEPVISIICLVVAAVVAWFKGGIVFPIMSAILTAVFLNLF